MKPTSGSGTLLADRLVVALARLVAEAEEPAPVEQVVRAGAVEAHHERPRLRRVVGRRDVDAVRLERAVDLGAVGLREGAGPALPRVLAGREPLGVGARGRRSCRFTNSQSRGRLAEVGPAHLGVLDEHLGRGQADVAQQGVEARGLRPGPGRGPACAASRSRGYSGVTSTTLLREASAWPSSPVNRAASRYWPSATSGTVQRERALDAAPPRRGPRPRRGRGASRPGGRAGSARPARAPARRASAPSGTRKASVTFSPGKNARRRVEERLRLVRRGDGLVVAERVDRGGRHLDALGERLRVERLRLLRRAPARRRDEGERGEQGGDEGGGRFSWRASARESYCATMGT